MDTFDTRKVIDLNGYTLPSVLFNVIEQYLCYFLYLILKGICFTEIGRIFGPFRHHAVSDSCQVDREQVCLT